MPLPTVTLTTAPADADPAAAPGAVFDVCHVGTVLRVVLFAEGLLLLGALFVTSGLAAAVERAALATGAAVPALALWLGTACAMRRVLASLSPPAQQAAAAALGAACAGIGWLLVQWAGLGLVDLGPWWASTLAGATLGAVVAAWLQLRQRSRPPTEVAARLAELQSRIRPHFLFNTLNSALGLIRRDPPRAEAVLEDLAELFRVALADSAATVSLGDEIDLARRYLAIEHTRFGDRLRVDWVLEPAAAAARLPPLLLQPLVENAVRHGIEPSPTGGTLRVQTQVKGGMAWVEITNTLPEAAPGPGTSGHGMALQNVRERLRLMHDVAARFDTHADAKTYRVQIGLPL